MYIATRKLTKKLYELMRTSISRKIRYRNALVHIRWVSIVGILCLVSCQNFSIPEEPLDTEQLKIYQGRIAFKSPDESFVSLFRWEESNENFRITLRDRLAFGGVRIQGDENKATVEFSNGEKEENVNLDSWIEVNLGIPIPFVEMWKCLSLKCVLIDEADLHEYDAHGRLIAFTHNLWTFTFSYLKPRSSSSVLRKLELKKDDTEIRIFFSKFEN